MLDFVERWRQAWQSKQIDEYISCYVESFTNDRRDRSAWRAYKEKLNRKYKTISVKVSDIKVDWRGKGAKATFRQIYKSDKYFADGHKILFLAYEDNAWGIEKELWVR